MHLKTCEICGREFYSRHKENRTCSHRCAMRLRKRNREGSKAEPGVLEAREIVQFPDGSEHELKHCKVCGKPYVYPYLWVDDDGYHSTGVECCCIQHTDILYGYGGAGGYHKKPEKTGRAASGGGNTK